MITSGRVQHAQDTPLRQPVGIVIFFSLCSWHLTTQEKTTNTDVALGPSLAN